MARNKTKKKGKKRKNTRKSKKRQFSFLRFAMKWTLVLGLWAIIAVTALFAWYAQDLPDITKNSTFERKQAIIVKAANGETVARYGDIIGNSITTEDMPPHLIQAVLAIEDRRFYHHFGLDPIGLTRAMFVNVRKGRVAQGGSTITQQLAKNLFLSRERTLKRKIQEAMLAFWLEYELTKDEILSAYLNRVYLGGGTFGVDAASKLYFEKEVKDLNLRESATIAALLKAPSRYSPLRNRSLSRKRTNLVLGAMVDAGYITEQQARGQSKAPPKPTQKPTNIYADRFYADWIVDQLEEIIGTPQEDLIVETTLNPKLQGHITTTIDSVIGRYGEEKNITEGAFVLMRPNGAVVALVGGRNYTRSQFNRATQSLRPAGSSFKPIVYLTALEQGWSPEDLIDDAPITDWRYRPKNFGNKYYGEVTLEEALTYSLNTAAVRLMKETGPTAVLNAATRLGITSKLEPDLSLALGSSGVTLLEMATAYATIANGGLKIEPYGITKITSKDGELYYQRPPTSRLRRVFDQRNINDITNMMSSVMEFGTGRGAAFGVPAAGKTGTSNDSRDALFMGFTRELVGVAWLGNDDNSPMKGVTGGSHPASIWRQVMRRAQGQYRPVNYAEFQSGSAFENLLQNLFFGERPENQNQTQNRRPRNDNSNIDQKTYNQRFNN